jgi:hypothetical protein
MLGYDLPFLMPPQQARLAAGRFADETPRLLRIGTCDLGVVQRISAGLPTSCDMEEPAIAIAAIATAGTATATAAVDHNSRHAMATAKLVYWRPTFQPDP